MQALANLVPRGSRVLDLGCGNGAFLSLLQSERGCTGYGVEIDDANVLACVERGVSVIQLNLEQGLSMFEDHSFDVVLQIDTLQHLRNAETMLRETDVDGTRGHTLEVRVSNVSAIRLYESLGFRPAGMRRGYYTDDREDALIMWRGEGPDDLPLTR
jgi:ubiquinone/menaquinone biosynthesis C-methylase UbiE